MICLFAARSETSGNKSNAAEWPAPPTCAAVTLAGFPIALAIKFVNIGAVLLEFHLCPFACSEVIAIEVTTTCLCHRWNNNHAPRENQKELNN
jgi:hypothetical protein